MRHDLHIHLHVDLQRDPRIDQILTKLDTINQQETAQVAALEDLQAEVANNTTVEGSALALIQGFAAQLAAAGTDPAALAALTATLNSNDTALAAAVAANTPAPPVDPAEPTDATVA